MRRRSIILGRGHFALYEAAEAPGAPAPQPPAPTPPPPGDGGETQPGAGPTPAEVNAARAAQRKAEAALAKLTADSEKAERERMTEADRARAERDDARREADEAKRSLRGALASQAFDRAAISAGLTGDRLAAVAKLANLDNVDPETPDSAIAELEAVKKTFPSLFEGVGAAGAQAQPGSQSFGAPAGGSGGPDPSKGEDAATMEGRFLAGLLPSRRGG